jgi:riboflavin kinase/FMN adenylyltransferase
MVRAAHPAGALAVVATFDRHPDAVVAPDRAPPAISTPAQQERALAGLDADALWRIRFDAGFRQLSGEQFVRDLVRGFGRVTAICVGSGFRFGHRRQGNVALLEHLGGELGFATEAVEPLRIEGQVVSSTLLRALIREGDLAAARRFLGRPYALAGTVVHGDQLGRQLGFPTANLDVAGLVLPPPGVYAARVHGPDGPAPAVMNLGHRPTLDPATPLLRLEVHLLDGAPDLYGRELEVAPVARLRDETRFGSLAALQAQIAQDVQAARRFLDATPELLSGNS